jgi:hypothetical protein
LYGYVAGVVRKRLLPAHFAVGRCTLCTLLTPTYSSSDWLKCLSANEKA